MPAAARRALPLLVLALAGCGTAAAPSPAPVDAGGERAAAADRPTPAAETEPARPRGRWVIARVTSPTALRTAPGGSIVARIGRRTEFGSERWVGVTGRRGSWLRVVVPERPNGRRAWIRASATRTYATDLSLHVDLSERMLQVRDRDRVVHRMPVAIGAAGSPTPTGRFAVTDKLTMGGPGTTYGCCAVALSGHQGRLPAGWSGGDRLAVHGTQLPGTIGEAASLGCLRAHDADLRHLLRTVPLGAPVWIRA